ncbi:MAG TPA: ABC transporter permease [Thermoanaerobaculia bacterium]|nr:ABC transporter permease [Thermoanaerobaculia bacterium]
MFGLLDDLRYAVRTLAKSRWFTLAAIAILVLGIGANTAIFSLVDTVLFRELPIEEPSRVVRLFAAGNDPGGLSSSSYPSYLDYRDQASSFDGLAAYSSGVGMSLAVGTAAPERVSGAIVTGEYFETIGVGPLLGRTITPEDARVRGEGAVVVLGHRLWEQRFGADPSALGRSVRINSRPFTVVGVAPRGFWGTDFDEPAQLWLPISMTGTAMPQFPVEMIDGRGFSWLDVIGRLAPGVSFGQAEAEVRAIGTSRAASQESRDPLGTLRPAASVARGTGERSEVMTKISWILLGVVGVVLLIACADLAGLMLVRGGRREHEIALRLAMGSSRARVVRQLLVECVLLALVAALGSLVVAIWGVRAFVAALPPDSPFPFEMTARVIDLRVLLATAAIALLSGLAFGTLPALRAARADLVRSLRNEPARGSSRSRLGSAFVVIQVTLAGVLLVTAGLLVRTLGKMRDVDPGFDPAGRIVATVDLGSAGYALDAMPAAWERILAQTRSIPGVRAAGLARSVPVQRAVMRHSVSIEGYEPPPGVYPNVDFNLVSPGYFEALGLPVLRGRAITEADREGTPPVAVISRAMAEHFWPGRDPIGEWIGEVDAEVVGVVADVRNRTLRDPAPPTLYRPVAQTMAMSALTLLVESDRPPASMMHELSAAMRRLDPHLPLFSMRTLRQKLGYAVAQETLLAGLLGAFALLALVLSAGGLYSLIAYRTELRQKEFGIRMALGAERKAILAGVLRESLTLTLLGLAIGAAIAALVTRFAETLLFGISPLDPLTFGAVGLLLLAAGAAAGHLPARRAAGADPATILRHE